MEQQENNCQSQPDGDGCDEDEVLREFMKFVPSMAAYFGKIAAKMSAVNKWAETKKQKMCITFTKKEIESMPKIAKDFFECGDRIIRYRLRKTGIYEARYRRDGYHIEVASKDFNILKKKFLDALIKASIEMRQKKEAAAPPEPEQPPEEKPEESKPVVLFRKAVEEWLEVKKRTVKPGTFTNYKNNAKTYILPELGDIPIEQLDRSAMQQFINKFIDTDRLRTAQVLRHNLRSIFDLVENDYGKPNPMTKVVIPYHETKKGEALTYEEERLLVDYCIAHSGEGPTSALLILLLFGLRRGEVASMSFDGIWLSCATLKGRLGRKENIRRIPISPVAKRYLQYIDFDKAKATPGDTMLRTLKEVLPNHHPHELRHTFISRAKECGVIPEVVSVWAGHSLGSTVTSIVYTHYSPEVQLREVEKIDYEI